MSTNKLSPAKRVAGTHQDVWSFINEAAVKCPIQPCVHMGQGFFGYNPPQFILDAAKEALDRVDCNQYSPTKGRPRLKKAISEAYAPFWSHKLDPDTEIVVTTGANEGILCACMAFLDPGDEVIIFEPFFDQYPSNIEMAGGKVVTVTMHPPKNGDRETCSAGEWKIDFDQLERCITTRTKMLIMNSPHNPVGKVFTREELERIADICLKNQIIILSDEVYDRLFYTPFTRLATLRPEVEKITLTIGSAGKNFYATGWRVGWLMGPAELIQYVAASHTRICFATPSPLQEACAVGFEQAEAQGFWRDCIADTQQKMRRFNIIWHELGLPYSEPEGGYFVMVNMSKVDLPADYPFPPHVASRIRNFRLAWFLCQEFGVASIPPSDFVLPANATLVENYLRFAVCKPDDMLDLAKERLRGLAKYIKHN